MLEFQLFRIKIYPSAQITIYNNQLSPQEILREAILATPSEALWGGVQWHVGDVEQIDSSGYYFRFGKTTKATFETYHDGHFEDAEFETTPYTHVLIDVELEVVGIAKKQKIANTTKGIANQLQRLLSSCEVIKKPDFRVEISEIQDPESFIAYIQRAYNISRFAVSFSLPNPWDVNEDYIKPAQKTLTAINGNKGKLEVVGDDLNADPLEEMARSAASTGDDASVRIQEHENDRPITKHLKGKAVTISGEDFTEQEIKENVLKHIRDVYHKLRNRSE